jgi:hypothetical protein
MLLSELRGVFIFALGIIGIIIVISMLFQWSRNAFAKIGAPKSIAIILAIIFSVVISLGPLLLIEPGCRAPREPMPPYSLLRDTLFIAYWILVSIVAFFTIIKDYYLYWNSRKGLIQKK